MTDYSPAKTLSLTLNELLDRHVLPLGTEIRTAQNKLDRTARWVTIVQHDPASLYLEPGELVILAPREGQQQTAAQKRDVVWNASADTLTGVISRAAELQAAALIISEQPSPLATLTAESVGLPLLVVPVGTHIRELERAIVAQLLDHHSVNERRSMQIYEQLIALASENITLERLIQELSRYTGKGVLLQDKNLRRLHEAIPPEYAGVWDDVFGWLSERRELPVALKDRHRLPRHASATVRQQIPNTSLVRLITPIITQHIGRGFLTFIGDESQINELDALILDHGAVVCALEMARAKAVSEAHKKLRGDLIDAILSGTVSEAEAVSEGDRFGHEMSPAHVALVLNWYGAASLPTMRRLETIVNTTIIRQRASALVRLRENELIVFFSADSGSLIESARDFAKQIIAESRRERPDAHLAIGIGRESGRVNEWRSSYRDAGQASDIARRLKSADPTYIGDLGIYTFLVRDEFKQVLRELRNNTLGDLIKTEEKQRTDLLQTLEAFFQCHGNHTQTAEMLSVHRNTLFYRMNRIAETIKMDLNRPDVRLAVHLSLKIHRLLENEG